MSSQPLPVPEAVGAKKTYTDDEFDVQVASADGDIVVSVHGEVDAATAPRLWKALSYVLPGVGARLVIDLVDTRFIDTTGMAVFVRTWKQLRTAGADLVLRSPNRTARTVLNLTGIDNVILVED